MPPLLRGRFVARMHVGKSDSLQRGRYGRHKRENEEKERGKEKEGDIYIYIFVQSVNDRIFHIGESLERNNIRTRAVINVK